MSIRNYAELGINLYKIIKRLLSNDNLVKLLYYTEQNPLEQPTLTSEEKERLIFEKLIKTIPRIGAKESEKSIIAVYIPKANGISGNSEFKNITIFVDVVVPLTQWYINGSNFRPFAILGEIQETLGQKTVNGLGKISGGDFELNFITDDVVCYQQTFSITEYA